MFEVRIKREFHRGPPRWLRSIFIFLAICNFARWGSTITDSVCKFDLDNGIVVGKDIWVLLRPLLRSSIVFYRILSACLYWTLAFPEQETNRQLVPRRYDRAAAVLTRRVCGICRLMCNIATANLPPDRPQPAHWRVSEQTVQCVRNGNDARFTYKVVTSKQLRLADNLYVASFPGVAAILIPPFMYGFMSPEEGNNNGFLGDRFIVELILCGLIICFSLSLLLALFPANSNGSREIDGDDDIARDAEGYDIFDPGQPDCRLERFKSWLNGKKWIFNAEALTFSIFGTAAVIFHLIAVGYFSNKSEVSSHGNMWTSLFGIFSSFFQLLVILAVKFRNKTDAATARRHSSLIASSMAILFSLSLSSLVVAIQREEFDDHIERFLPFKILMPLLVDFRIHASLLNFSMLTDFLQHRYPKGDDFMRLQRNYSEEIAHCAVPGCNRRIFPGPELHMTCKRCGRQFCDECCDVVISQTRTCTCVFEA